MICSTAVQKRFLVVSNVEDILKWRFVTEMKKGNSRCSYIPSSLVFIRYRRGWLLLAKKGMKSKRLNPILLSVTFVIFDILWGNIIFGILQASKVLASDVGQRPRLEKTVCRRFWGYVDFAADVYGVDMHDVSSNILCPTWCLFREHLRPFPWILLLMDSQAVHARPQNAYRRILF